MVNLVKSALYTTVGKATLSSRKPDEVLLDIENTLNNRPLTYVEGDAEYPILSPNTIVIGQNLMLPSILENSKKQRGSDEEKNIPSI